MRKATGNRSVVRLGHLLCALAILIVLPVSVGPGSASAGTENSTSTLSRDVAHGSIPSMFTPDALFVTEADGAALQLVQFVGPIKDEWLQTIETLGATPVYYIATNGYLLWADAEGRANLDKLVEQGDFMLSSELYPLDRKVGPALAARENPDEIVPVVIQMYRHDGRGGSELAIQSITVDQFSDWTPILEFQNINASLR